jgi:hypothetical protein
MPQTKRQQDITMLLTAFEQFFPGVETPHIKFVCAWLYRLPVENILECMERVAQTDAENPFNSPTAAIWNLVRNASVSYSAAVRYDANGQTL